MLPTNKHMFMCYVQQRGPADREQKDAQQQPRVGPKALSARP
jgi:hypothetical protein